jgi:Acetyltransferases
MPDYRRAALRDAELLAELRCEMLFGGEGPETPERNQMTELTKHFFEQMLSNGTTAAFLAEEEGIPVGTGAINYFLLPPNDWCPSGITAYVGNMFVRPEFRRRGIASALLKMLLEDAKARGCERIILNPTAEGMPLYRKFGFEPWSDALALYPKGKGGQIG